MRVHFLALLVLMSIALSGCTGALKRSGENDVPTGATSAATESNFYYYFFDDIVVPREMELDAKSSMVFGNATDRSGVMVFSGRVEFVSLTNAFLRNMRNEGWELKFQFSSSRTLLLFTKAEKFCVVNITDGRTTTDLEIWVAPRPSGNTIEEKPMDFFSSPAPAGGSGDSSVKEAPIEE